MMPRHQLGYVLPVPVGDYLHYQFYRVCPPDCSIVCIPLGLESFTPSGADAAFEWDRGIEEERCPLDADVPFAIDPFDLHEADVAPRSDEI